MDHAWFTEDVVVNNTIHNGVHCREAGCEGERCLAESDHFDVVVELQWGAGAGVKVGEASLPVRWKDRHKLRPALAEVEPLYEHIAGALEAVNQRTPADRPGGADQKAADAVEVKRDPSDTRAFNSQGYV